MQRIRYSTATVPKGNIYQATFIRHIHISRFTSRNAASIYDGSCRSHVGDAIMATSTQTMGRFPSEREQEERDIVIM